MRLSVLDRVGCPRLKLMLCSSRPKTEEKELIHRFLSYFLAPRVLFVRAMQNDFVCHLFVSLLQSIVENEKVLSSLKTTISSVLPLPQEFIVASPYLTATL